MSEISSESDDYLTDDNIGISSDDSIEEISPAFQEVRKYCRPGPRDRIVLVTLESDKLTKANHCNSTKFPIPYICGCGFVDMITSIIITVGVDECNF